MEPQDVYVVGLGAMGGAVAAHLAELGHRVAGHDPDPAARERAHAAGVDARSELEPGEADFVLTSLANSEVLRAAWFGAAGLRDRLTSRSTVLELSSIDPDTMREIAASGAAAGIRVLDCPVSGGPGEARTGQLTVLVGADEADLAIARPLLADIGSTIEHTGPCGTGKIVKIVNNMMAMGNVLVAAEAFTVGVQAGVDPQRLLEVLSVSGGRSHHLTKRFPNALRVDYRPGFALRLGEKDVGLGLDLARSVAVPAPAASMVRELFRIGLAEGLGEQDIVAIIKLYQGWAGAAAVPA